MHGESQLSLHGACMVSHLALGTESAYFAIVFMHGESHPGTILILSSLRALHPSVL
jgi:hypothetical protein